VVFLQYPEAMEYLQGLTKFGFNFGLDRVKELLRRLGNPHLRLKVLHIGGTNGKGSTLAMIASVLQTAGYKTGSFISPHLHSYTERFVINGEQISCRRVAELITRLRPHLDDMVAGGFEHPTEFEVSTAMAFVYFFEEQVDFLILEVGLGGAVDSTNVITPAVSVITNIGMDHMNYLGRTITEIATVKAGIIKENVPVVTAADNTEALAVISRVCRQKKAPLVRVLSTDTQIVPDSFYRPVTCRLNSFSLAGQYFNVQGLNREYHNLFLPLLGRHQIINAATAVAALELLIEKEYVITTEAICLGLADTCWPARLEIFDGSPEVILDGAHNYDGAKSLRRALADYFSQKEIILVLGMLGDKEREKIINELVPRARAVIITRPNSPRALNWQSMAGMAGLSCKEVYAIESVEEALAKAFHIVRQDEVICITGSLYMVAQAREVLPGYLSRANLTSNVK